MKNDENFLTRSSQWRNLRRGFERKSVARPTVILCVVETASRRCLLKAIVRAKRIIANDVGPVLYK